MQGSKHLTALPDYINIEECCLSADHPTNRNITKVIVFSPNEHPPSAPCFATRYDLPILLTPTLLFLQPVTVNYPQLALSTLIWTLSDPVRVQEGVWSRCVGGDLRPSKRDIPNPLLGRMLHCLG